MNGKHFDIKDMKREYSKGFKDGALKEIDEIEYVLTSGSTSLTRHFNERRKMLEK